MSSSVSRNVDYVKVVDALADVVKELNRGAPAEFADPAAGAAAHAAAAEYGATDQGGNAEPARASTRMEVWNRIEAANKAAIDAAIQKAGLQRHAAEQAAKKTPAEKAAEEAATWAAVAAAMRAFEEVIEKTADAAEKAYWQTPEGQAAKKALIDRIKARG